MVMPHHSTFRTAISTQQSALIFCQSKVYGGDIRATFAGWPKWLVVSCPMLCAVGITNCLRLRCKCGLLSVALKYMHCLDNVVAPNTTLRRCAEGRMTTEHACSSTRLSHELLARRNRIIIAVQRHDKQRLRASETYKKDNNMGRHEVILQTAGDFRRQSLTLGWSHHLILLYTVGGEQTECGFIYFYLLIESHNLKSVSHYTVFRKVENPYIFLSYVH